MPITSGGHGSSQDGANVEIAKPRGPCFVPCRVDGALDIVRRLPEQRDAQGPEAERTEALEVLGQPAGWAARGLARRRRAGRVLQPAPQLERPGVHVAPLAGACSEHGGVHATPGAPTRAFDSMRSSFREDQRAFRTSGGGPVVVRGCAPHHRPGVSCIFRSAITATPASSPGERGGAIRRGRGRRRRCPASNRSACRPGTPPAHSCGRR